MSEEKRFSIKSLFEQHWTINLMFLGPAFHLGYFLYVFGADILSVAAYAEMSMAMPVSFLILLVCMLGIPALQVHRKSARLALILWALAYIIIAFASPWLGSIFNISQLLVISPLLVNPVTSPIWAIISYAGCICYGLTLVGALGFEIKKVQTVFPKENMLSLNRITKFKPKGTVAFICALVVGALLITGNTSWYRQTYQLHYDADIDMAIEYWRGIDEQEVNGTYTIVNATPIDAGDNVQVDISPLKAESDPFWSARFLFDYVNDTYDDYETWYHVGKDFSTLYLLDISAELATRLEMAANGTKELNLTCVGYRESRLEALKATHAVIVLSSEGLGHEVPQYIINDTPEFNATCWLYYNWGIKIQAPVGCGIGFLEEFEMLRDRLLAWQDTRIKGPWYYRYVIEGSMFNVEKVDMGTRGPLIEQYMMDNFGIEVDGSDSEFGAAAYAMNTMTEETYWSWIEQWNDFIDYMYNNITWGNGTVDESIRFKVINCGIPENLLDYFDGDPDFAMYLHNLGFGTHFAVDGYMFYRGADEPYWTYGYVNLLSQKPKVVPHEEKLVLLGCMHHPPYTHPYPLEEGSRFRIEGEEWTRDVNGDGLANGFDALMLDIMMCGAKGIRRVNLWPGPGPRSPDCCDYREFPRDLMPNGDFFIEMKEVLENSTDIEFQFSPGSEHFWDKELTDITMDMCRPIGLVVFVFGALIYFSLLVKNQNYMKKLKTSCPRN